MSSNASPATLSGKKKKPCQEARPKGRKLGSSCVTAAVEGIIQPLDHTL
ncbi:MAG: hypothetical protein JAY97_09885 [Candidatus Thiodiazotropha sp. 'RUGA']|nr:hypothetical protein [Candidatus Thiodiazotropha sp. 'RUGA']